MRASATTLEPEISAEEMAALQRALHAQRLSGPHLEIGTAAGGTLRELMRSYPTENRPRFVVVDPMTYFPDQLSIVRRNLASVGIDADSVNFRISSSWSAFWAAERAGERYSFMFIDGSHKAHRVMQDICWARLLEPGGLLCFHDYTPRLPGVVFAVDRLRAASPNYKIVEKAGSMVVLRKAAASAKPEVSRSDLLLAQVVNLWHQLSAGARKRLHGKA
jgi:predicted O-methyltransferase YrrM